MPKACFTPPTEQQVHARFAELGFPAPLAASEAVLFVAHYTANGWRVGQVPMKDWRAACVTWKGNFQKRSQTRPPAGQLPLESPERAEKRKALLKNFEAPL
jgi:hypothetical protein